MVWLFCQSNRTHGRSNLPISVGRSNIQQLQLAGDHLASLMWVWKFVRGLKNTITKVYVISVQVSEKIKAPAENSLASYLRPEELLFPRVGSCHCSWKIWCFFRCGFVAKSSRGITGRCRLFSPRCRLICLCEYARTTQDGHALLLRKACNFLSLPLQCPVYAHRSITWVVQASSLPWCV